MADISQITLPSGSTYTIKDTIARSSIPTKTSDITNDTNYVGASFVGTALVFSTAGESIQQAEGVSF